MVKNTPKVKVAPVGEYAERPFEDAAADPDELLLIEDRGPDLDPTYHERNKRTESDIPSAVSSDELVEVVEDASPVQGRLNFEDA